MFMLGVAMNSPALWAVTWQETGKVVFIFVLVLLVGEALPLALLLYCWWIGDVSFRTKIVLTALYLAHFGLLLVPFWFPNVWFLYGVSKPILIGVLGGVTFGGEWLMRNPRGGNR
jgi:hypothetical protein